MLRSLFVKFYNYLFMPKLKPIPNVTKFADGIIRILGANPGPMTLQGTNSYLIGKGKRRLLIDTTDPNTPDYINALEKTLKEENSLISKIIATHWHHDHIGSIPEVLKKSSLVTEDVEVWKYPRSNTEESMPFFDLKNLQEFDIDGDFKLKIYHTPGHTTDHVILFDSKSKILFSGDTILGEGTAVFEDLYDYMKSLEIILKLEPKVIYPAHGDLIEDPAKNINYYIQHRNEREQQILNAIEKSSVALNALQIVRQVYTTTPMHLWFAAVKVANQHLGKLKKEGKIAEIAGYTGTYWQSATKNKL